MVAIASALWAFITNPTVVFLLLTIGLWALAAAMMIPGTGIPEGVAVVALALGALGLIQLPVNFSGLALMALAVFLVVLEFQQSAHGALLVAGSISYAVGALLLFRVPEGPAALLSWVVVVGITALQMAAFGFLIWRGLAAQRLPVLQDLSRLVGQRGVAQTGINGAGTVQVSGELWSAKSDTPITAGSSITVVGREGLWLKVASAPPAADKHS
jgi:membrane-bound serine protease (ClpP class)